MLAAFFPIYYSEIYPEPSNSRLLTLFYHKITVCQGGFEKFFQKFLIFFIIIFSEYTKIRKKGQKRFYTYKVDKKHAIYYNYHCLNVIWIIVGYKWYNL